jgi:hypothetical protein
LTALARQNVPAWPSQAAGRDPLRQRRTQLPRQQHPMCDSDKKWRSVTVGFAFDMKQIRERVRKRFSFNIPQLQPGAWAAP